LPERADDRRRTGEIITKRTRRNHAPAFKAGQSSEQAKVQRQGAGAPKDRQDSVHAFALPDASGYDQPSEPPTGIQPGILAVLFRVFATGRGAFNYSPDCPGFQGECGFGRP
jgi:hypothetical protein